jgi:hypothetical protein
MELFQSSNINFLIGAGASMPLLNILGPVEGLLTEIANSSVDSNSLKIVEVSILKYYFDNSILNNSEVFTENKTKKAEETLNSYRDFFKTIKQLLILRSVSLLHKKVNLFTTNMDILMEKSLEDLNFEYIDGFAGRILPKLSLSNYNKTVSKLSSHYDKVSEIPMANLYKIHGSINWKKNPDSIVYDQNFENLRRLSEISFSESELLNPLNDDKFKDIEVLLQEASNIGFSKKHVEFDDLYKKFQFINPTKKKFEETTLNYTYYEMLRMLSNALEKENSVLYVTGFSFADEHLKEIIVRSLNSNPTLQICVLPFNEEAKADIENNLGIDSLKLVNNNLRYINHIRNTDEELVNYDLNGVTQEYFLKILNSVLKDDRGN